MIQQMLQAKTRKNKCETVKYAAKVVECRLKDLQTKHEQGREQQVVIESWQEQEGEVDMRGYLPTEDARVKVLPSGVISSGGADRQQAIVTASRQKKRHRKS